MEKNEQMKNTKFELTRIGVKHRDNSILWQRKSKEFKKQPGVYALYIDTICVYIGMSKKNVLYRVRRFYNKNPKMTSPELSAGRIHDNALLKTLLQRSKNVCVDIYLCTTPTEAILLEQELIQQLHPFFNKHWIPIRARHIISIKVDNTHSC